MSNFISNSSSKKLSDRIKELVLWSKELKFLVGFFYFSGIDSLFEALQKKKDLPIKILVGLDVDKINYQIVEYSDKEAKKYSAQQHIEKFFQSVKNSINSDDFDNEKFVNRINFFLNKILDGSINIRKTYDPNHSKLYLFKLEDTQFKKSVFITGSSNLTKAGLEHQNEFNVEISDYGCDEAEKYFDNLWEKSIKITEDNETKTQLINIIENETHFRKVTPFEAYLYILQSYIETYEFKDASEEITHLMKKNGYNPYKYQLDAVNIALNIIEKYKGVIISDVVGLGKTVITCLIARQLQKLGLVICPPNLIGDDYKKSGWRKYLNDFELYGWEAKSCGDLQNILNYVKNNPQIEVIVIDEAHRFRNEDTQSYEYLKNICRGKIVILLTATPFNNRPSDIFALLKLFTIPRQSNLAFDDNIESVFTSYKTLFKNLGYITKYFKSKDYEKLKKVKNLYKKYFGEENINLEKVKKLTITAANEIRSIIEPIIIRRNRIDLIKNPRYKDEVKDLPEVEAPIEWFYELDKEQINFYDEIINKIFADPKDNGKFTGAIYRPFHYEEGVSSIDIVNLKDEENSNEKSLEKNRELMIQQNLFDLMRRILVRRFESSFGAFKQSIENFKSIHEKVLTFITKTGKGNPLEGKYFLIRDLIDKVSEASEEDYEDIEQIIIDYENEFFENFKDIEKDVLPRNLKPYVIKNFKQPEKFINDIKNDINLFSEILEKIEKLKLTENDPKIRCLKEKLKEELNKKPEKNEPKRKIIIFSEFADTVKHISQELENDNFRVLTIYGEISSKKINEIYANFDASYGKDDRSSQSDDYDILLGTDKISEGFNLNRAGMIINYDIPWNPVRVIQRLGRINRISKKVFNKLYIVNFFPTEKGADIIKSREIAQNKMFMIHTILGEDVKIFDSDETPSPSKLYSKLVQNPEKFEKESFFTIMYEKYLRLKEQYPEIIKNLKNLPKRIKVSRINDYDNLIVVFKKNRLFSIVNDYQTNTIREMPIESIINMIECGKDEKGVDIDSRFWDVYEKIKEFKNPQRSTSNEQSIYVKALNNLKKILNNKEYSQKFNQVRKFLMDLREDITDFGTLSDFTLRRIANLNTDFKDEKDFDKTIKDINEIKDLIGEDFLDIEKARLNKVEKEIIIAFENKKDQGNIYGE